MPRKTPVRELQKEETTVSSPLRRSSRISSSSPAPVMIKTRRSSASETATSTPKVTKSRRSSFSQELEAPNENDNENKSTKTPRTRKGSFSSKNNENNASSEEAVTKRATRASSVTKEDTSDVKKPITRRRRSSSQEVEMNEEKSLKVTRTRTNSVTKKNEKAENGMSEDNSAETEPEVTNVTKKSEDVEILNEESPSPVVNGPKSNVAKKKVDLDLSVINEASLTEEDILQEEGVSSVPSNHAENLKEDQSEETKKNNLAADATTETSTKTNSEPEVSKKLVVNLEKLSPRLLPIVEECTPIKENTTMETVKSNTSDNSFKLQLSSSVLESSVKNETDTNVSPAGNKENIRPQEKPEELECEPMDVDDSDIENSFSSKLNKTQSPVLATTSKVANVTQELRIAEKVTNEIDQFLKEEITYTSNTSLIKTKRSRLSLKNSSSFDDQKETNSESSGKESVEVQKEKESNTSEEKPDVDKIAEKEKQSPLVPPSSEEIVKEDQKASLLKEKLVQAVEAGKEEEEESTLNERSNTNAILEKLEDIVKEDKRVEVEEEEIEAVSGKENTEDDEISFDEDTEESFRLEIAETDSVNDSNITEEVVKEDVQKNVELPISSASTEKETLENNKMQSSSSVELKENDLNITDTEISEKPTQEIKETTVLKKSTEADLEPKIITNEKIEEKADVDETPHETVEFKRPADENIQNQDQTTSEIELEDDSELMLESEKSLQTDENESLNEEISTKLQESNDAIIDNDKLDNVVSTTDVNSEKTDLSNSLSETKDVEDNDDAKVNSENCVDETLKDVSQVSVEKESSEDSSIEIPKPVFGKSSKVIITSDILIQSPKQRVCIYPLKKNATDKEKATEFIDEKSAENEKNYAKEDNEVTNVSEEDLSENNETCEESNIEVNSIVQEVEQCVSPKKEYRSPQKKVKSKAQVLPIDCTTSNSSEEETDTVKEMKQNAVSEKDVSLIDSKYEIVVNSKQTTDTVKEDSTTAVCLFEEIVVVSDNEKDEEESGEQDKTVNRKEENEDKKVDTNEIMGEILVSSDSESEVKEVPVQESTDTTANDNSNSLKRRSVDKTSIVMHGSIKAGDDKEKCLSDRIHKVVDLFCAGISNKSDVSINVSLEYTGNFSESDDEASPKKDNLQVSLTAVQDPKEKQICDIKGSKRRKLYHPHQDEGLVRSADVSENKSDEDSQTLEENKDDTNLAEVNVQKNVNKQSKKRNKKSATFSESDISYGSPQIFKESLTEEKDFTSPVKKQRTYKDTPYKSAKSNNKSVVDKQENVGKDTGEDGAKIKKKGGLDQEFSETEDIDEEENEPTDTEIEENDQKHEEENKNEAIEHADSDQKQTVWKPFSKYFSSVSESESETLNEDDNDTTWAPSREINSSDSDLCSEDEDDSDISEEEEQSPPLIIRSPLVGHSSTKANEVPTKNSEENSSDDNEDPSFTYGAKTSDVVPTSASEVDEVFNRSATNVKSPSPKRNKRRKHSQSEDHVSQTLEVEEVEVVRDEKKKQKSPVQKRKKGENNKVALKEGKESTLLESSSTIKNPKGESTAIEKKSRKRSHLTHTISEEEFTKAKKPSVASQKVPTLIVNELSTSKLQVTKKECTKTTRNKSSKKMGKVVKITYLKPSTSMSTSEWEVKPMS